MGSKLKTRSQSRSGGSSVQVQKLEALTGCKLPSRGQVLGRMLHRMETLKESSHEAARFVIEEVSKFWDKGGIPMQDERRCVAKLDRLFEELKNLKKNAYRKSEVQRERHRNQEQEFMGSLDDLFDIAHADAMTIIKNQEDKIFLEMQRQKGRPGSFSGVDRKLAAKRTRLEQRSQKEADRRKKAEVEHETSMLVVQSSSLDLSDDPEPEGIESHSSIAEENVSSVPPLTKPHAERQERARNIMTSYLAATLDRVKLSDRNAVFVMCAVAKSLGHDLKTLAINRTSIRNARLHYREEIASKLRADAEAEGIVSVHWDGKLLPDLTGRLTVDRLPVLVSTYDSVHLLGVPKLSSGTGEAQASAVVESLVENALDDRVQSMVFDTTQSNTGQGKGACVLIEEKLERPLLWFACRHHIMELLLRAAWDSVFGASSAPTVPLFDRFQAAWCGPEQLQNIPYEPGMVDSRLIENIRDRDRIVQFGKEQIACKHPRDDYLELLELSLVSLGEKPTSKFKLPGPVSHARWMAKAIYSLKVWLFRAHFKLSSAERRRLCLFCEFVLSVYIEAWFQCTLPISAPRLDLELVQKLLRAASALPPKGNPYLAAANKLSSHLWYLSEEQVALALFDPDVSLEEKQKMSEAIQTRHGSKSRTKRLQVSNPHHVEKSRLSDFFNKNTQAFFIITGISSEFLLQPPENWNQLPHFRDANEILSKVRVINDVAERGVALIKSYNKLLTKDEEQLQFLLQVVEDHRKRFPDSKKSTILQSMSS